MLDSTAPELATLADPDWYVLAWVLNLAQPFGGAAIWVIPVAAVGVTVLVLLLLQRREARRDRRLAAAEESTMSSTRA